jgi:hypothetical protein
MPTVELILGNKFKALDEALYCNTKYVTIHAGRRTGKSFNAAQWLIDELLRERQNGLWVDTVQRNIDKYVDRYFRQITGDTWQYFKWDVQKKVLKFPNGSYIDFGSAERPELLEGFEYKRLVLNEAGIILKKSSLWDNTIAPMTKGDSKTRIIGTPKGRNRFWHLASIQANDWKDYHFTAYDSPYWNPEELDLIKTRVPELVWKQEYWADFIEGEGSVFRNLSRCYSKELLDAGIEGHSYLMAVDLAKHQDFTVIMIADQKTKQVVFMDRFNQIDWVLQKRRIEEVYNRFSIVRMILDSTGIGDTILDDLRNIGLSVEGVRFTAEIKRELVQNLSVAIDSQKLFFYPWEELISELELYEYEVTPSGNVSYNAPEGFHDDTVVALALLEYGLEKYTNQGLAVRPLVQEKTKDILARTFEVDGDQMPNMIDVLIKRQLKRK